MNIEIAFNKLTGDTGNCDTGKIRGTTKREVKKLCGDDWDERAWCRMVNASNRYKDRVSGELPVYNQKEKLWYWF